MAGRSPYGQRLLKMTNTQLNLFGGQINLPDKAINKTRHHNSRKAATIANQILREIKTETKETQQSIVYEVYYRTICENLDRMPKRAVNVLIVKLMERYFV